MQQGNSTEQTDQQQTKKAFKQNDEADEYKGEFGKHHLLVDQHSIEEIVGKKVIEALGAIDLLAGDDLTLGALGNMQVCNSWRVNHNSRQTAQCRCYPGR